MQKITEQLHRLLRWTEKYTKTDMVYLAHGSFWLILKRFVAGGIAISLALAFANLLDPTTYGEYKYVFSIFALLAIPTLLGMGDATTKSVAQGFEGTVIPALRTKILWGTIGSALSAGIAIYYYLMGNTTLAGAFFIITIFLPFVDTLGIFNSILTGKRLFKISILYETASQGISALVITATLFFTNNLLIILASYFCIYTLSRFIIFKVIMRLHKKNDAVDTTAIPYGKHLSAMRIIGTISESLDSILIWQFVGPAPLAVYAFAKAIPTQIRETLTSIPKIAFPKFAQRDFSEIRKTLLRRMFLIFLVVLVIIVIYIILAPYIFRILFPQYTESVFYSQLFALTLLFFPQKFIGMAFQAHAHKKALYISSTVAPISKIIFSIIFVPTFGILGAVMADIGGRTVNLFVLSYLFFGPRTSDTKETLSKQEKRLK